jgi:hypothetical protein
MILLFHGPLLNLIFALHWSWIHITSSWLNIIFRLHVYWFNLIYRQTSLRFNAIFRLHATWFYSIFRLYVSWINLIFRLQDYVLTWYSDYIHRNSTWNSVYMNNDNWIFRLHTSQFNIFWIYEIWHSLIFRHMSWFNLIFWIHETIGNLIFRHALRFNGIFRVYAPWLNFLFWLLVSWLNFIFQLCFANLCNISATRVRA